MRKMELQDGFCLTGKIPGAANPDIVTEVSLPFELQKVQELCGQEGLFLRSWELHALLTRPEEPVHSRAERTLLTLDGVYGAGEVCVGESMRLPLAPHMVLDVTEAILAGNTKLEIHFFPQHPRLLNGERGKDLIARGGLVSAELRNIYHMQIVSAELNSNGDACIRILAYGAGKIRLCLRLMHQEQLLWSENSTLFLHVGEQMFIRKIDEEYLRKGAVLRVSADMGGEGCDTCETLYSSGNEKPLSLAHFRKLPDESMLKIISEAGFEGIVVYDCPHKKIRNRCMELGLYCIWKREEMILNPILAPFSEYDTLHEGCLMVPMDVEGEAAEFQQAQRLSEAVLAHRTEGKICEILALSRQRDAQDGLFDAEGRPRMALYALKNALSKIVMWVAGEKRVYKPYEEFCEEIHLLCTSPDRKPAAVQAQLYTWSGREVACRVIPFCLKESVQSLGEIKARLPLENMQGLVLRMQCIRDGRILAVNHVYFSCADESGNRLPLPEADLTECGGNMLCNAGDTAAVGVTILCEEKVLLSHSIVLPQEHITLANCSKTVVKYGNAVMKGGKNSVKQRVLRGVFADQHTAPSDP